jgi:hypothetical protein
MNFLTLSFVLFSLVLDQVLSSLAFRCATNKSIFKKTYLEETEIFKSKIDQIIGCGANFKIGIENLRQEKYKTCIIEHELPNDYTSALINLKSSDFDNATNLKNAISVVGTNYCTNMINRFSNTSADMAKETLTTEVIIPDQILTQKFQLNGEKSSDIDGAEKKDIAVSETRFSIGYIIIGSVILIIMIAIIIYFCTGKRTDEKVMPPPTPMKPIQSLQQAPPTAGQQYQQAPLNQQYQPAPLSQQYQPAPHDQQYQQVPHAQQFPSPRPAPYFPSQSPVQQYPPPQQSQQFPTTSPLQPYPSPNSQASLPQSHGSSQVGLSLEGSPPSYHDVHRPFQRSNPYSKQ